MNNKICQPSKTTHFFPVDSERYHEYNVFMHKHTISKSEINNLPVKAYTGSVHLIDSDKKMVASSEALRGEKVLGFDTETRPAFKKGESYAPSLVQIAASDRVYVFQLRHITEHKLLIDILADKKVLKAGVAVDDDIKKLNDISAFRPAGFVELAKLAAGAGIKNAGIRGLAALLFDFRISKGKQCSRWDAKTLTPAQITYAATDAWVCRDLYFALWRQREGKRRRNG